MKKLKNSVILALTVLQIGALSSCQNDYDVRYELSSDGTYYTAYSDESETERRMYEGEVSVQGWYSFKPVKELAAYTFYNCKKIIGVTLSDGLESIGAYAFSGCENLAHVDLPESVSIIDSGAFKNSGLIDVYFKDNVKYVGIEAYTGCPLNGITVSPGNMYFDTTDGINSLVDKNNKLVLGCAKTRILDTVTEIGVSAFRGCEDLKTVSLPNSLRRIDDYAFADCKNLSKIEIPASVEYIGIDALNETKEILYNGTYQDWYKINERPLYYTTVQCTNGLITYTTGYSNVK